MMITGRLCGSTNCRPGPWIFAKIRDIRLRSLFFLIRVYPCSSVVKIESFRLSPAGSRHGAVSDRHHPVRIRWIEGFHRIDHLLTERRFDEAVLAGPDFELDAQKIPAAGLGDFDFADQGFAQNNGAELRPDAAHDML